MEIAVGNIFESKIDDCGFKAGEMIVVFGFDGENILFSTYDDSVDPCSWSFQSFVKQFKKVYKKNKIEVGKSYRVLKDYKNRGNYSKGDTLEITYIDKNEEYNRVDFLYNGTKSEFDSLEWIQKMELEEVDESKNKVIKYKEVKIGYLYRCMKNICGIKEGSLVEVLSVRRGIVKVLDGINHVRRIEKDEFLCGFALVGKVERKIRSVESALAYYDTAIDISEFAKTNFPMEQVKGFLRISAIDCLQQSGSENLDNLNKAMKYIQELIEMEEG